MNRLVVVIWLAVVALVAVVTGCDRAPRYDSRLVAADSLMQPAPDSALALVQAVAPGSLTGEADSAYRDLLLTQGRYRCYVTATSDSDINCALAYYRRHDGEREKLTRAFIYKGAVMEELGHPDSAMAYYKTAETTAAPDDYFNLGYANLRIGELYQTSGTNDSAVLVRMKQAAKYFTITRDTSYLITAIGTQGAYLYDKDKDASRLSLERALSLAKTINSPKRFQFQSKLSGLYYYNGEYEKSKDLAMDIIHNGRDECDENQFYYYAAWSFIRMSRTDSAQWVRTLIPAPATLVDSMNHHRLEAELAEVGGKLKEYSYHIALANDINDKLLRRSVRSNVAAKELMIEAQQSKKQAMTSLTYKYIGVVTLILIAMALILILVMKRAKARLETARSSMEASRLALAEEIASLELRLKQQEADYRQLLASKEIQLDEARMRSQQFKSRHEEVTKAINSRLAALSELYQMIRVKGHTGINTSRHPMPLRGLIRDMNDRQELMKVTPSELFWQKLVSSIDVEYHGLASYVKEQYPALKPWEWQLFLMLAAGIPHQVIKLCFGYDHVVTVSNYKKKMIEKIAGPEVSLESFIKQYMDTKSDGF